MTALDLLIGGEYSAESPLESLYKSNLIDGGLA